MKFLRKNRIPILFSIWAIFFIYRPACNTFYPGTFNITQSDIFRNFFINLFACALAYFLAKYLKIGDPQ